MYKLIIINAIIVGVIIYCYIKYNIHDPIKEETSIVYNPVSIQLPINKKLFSKNFMVEVISSDPKVFYLHNFLKEDELDELISKINTQKKESKVEILADSKPVEKIIKKIRTSSTAYFKKGSYPNIEERASNFANVHIDQIEALHGIVYKSGEYYKEHLDTFKEGSKYLKNGGNRIGTIFIYLNTLDMEDGGCTHFTMLKHKIRPVKCNAIYFENIKDGIIDNRLLHEGEKILNEKLKYGLNIWIRESKYVD